MAHGLSCSAACGILPGPGLEPMSPALAGGFLTTVPPGKSRSGASAHILLVKGSQWPCLTARKQGSTFFMVMMYATVVNCPCHQEAYILVVRSQTLNAPKNICNNLLC